MTWQNNVIISLRTILKKTNKKRSFYRGNRDVLLYLWHAKTMGYTYCAWSWKCLPEQNPFIVQDFIKSWCLYGNMREKVWKNFVYTRLAVSPFFFAAWDMLQKPTRGKPKHHRQSKDIREPFETRVCQHQITRWMILLFRPHCVPMN